MCDLSLPQLRYLEQAIAVKHAAQQQRQLSCLAATIAALSDEGEAIQRLSQELSALLS